MKRCLFKAAAYIALPLCASILWAAACSRTPPTFEEQRMEMVRTQIEQRGITNPEIRRAFLAVPREEFVLEGFREHAYKDLEPPSGLEQSLDRPYENALMIHALNITPESRVLEVGTGSGYLASLIAQIAREVYTIEIVPEIADQARSNIARLGYQNIHVKTGDGYLGWKEHAPFDAIVMTASPHRVPAPLEEQLREGGRIVLPMGGTERFQLLVMFEKSGGKLVERAKLMRAVFVPMQGIIREREK